MVDEVGMGEDGGVRAGAGAASASCVATRLLSCSFFFFFFFGELGDRKEEMATRVRKEMAGVGITGGVSRMMVGATKGMDMGHKLRPHTSRRRKGDEGLEPRTPRRCRCNEGTLLRSAHWRRKERKLIFFLFIQSCLIRCFTGL